MKCPCCGKENDRVKDSRDWMEGRGVRRRRECLDCGWKWSTVELPEDWEEPDDGDARANWYQAEAMRTAGTDSDKKLLLNGVMGLNGEAGECIDSLKKAMFQGHALDKPHLVEELGDVLWYVAISAQALGVGLGEVMRANVAKLRARYPEGFDKERSINR